MKNYEAAYAGYVHPAPKTNWSSEETVKKSLLEVDLKGKKTIDSGGIPIITDGEKAFVDNKDSHCIIYGTSGFKKSICVFMPLIGILAKAGENIVVTDPKGELYRRTASYLKNQNYKVLVLNFRDYNGEGYNPLTYPAKLYKEGNVDKAATVSANLISALAQKQAESGKCDPFWPDTAKAYNSGILPFMFSSYPDIDAVNFLSLSDYYTEPTVNSLAEYITQEQMVRNTATQNIRTVLAEPEKTRMSTITTCSSFIQPFIQNDKLARMLSHSTFELEELTKEKVALFIITDDSSTVCDPIVGVFISQLQSVLIDTAYHSSDGKLKVRENFLLDEFCSFPIPGIEKALATHRSRNIRYYLCVQSLDLLSKRYQKYKSMMANCASSIFLGSTETELLEMISKRCGTTEVTSEGKEKPLISIPELMTLKKEWYRKEAIYFDLASGIRYCTTLPSIEKYKSFCNCGESLVPDNTHPEVKFYSFFDLIKDVVAKKTNRPFSTPLKSKSAAGMSTRRKDEEADEIIQDDENRRDKFIKELEEKLDALFGELEDEEEE